MSEAILLKATEVAALLALSKSTVDTLIADGRLRSVHIGRAMRVHRADVEAFAEQLREEAAAAPPHLRLVNYQRKHF